MRQAPKVRLYKINPLGLPHFSYFASQMTTAGRHSRELKHYSVALPDKTVSFSKGTYPTLWRLWEQPGRIAEGPFLLLASFLKIKLRSCSSCLFLDHPGTTHPSTLREWTFIITGTDRPGNPAGRCQKSWGMKSQGMEGRGKGCKEPEESRGKGGDARFPGHQCHFCQQTISCMFCPAAADCWLRSLHIPWLWRTVFWRDSLQSPHRNRAYVSIYNKSKRSSLTHNRLWEHPISSSLNRWVVIWGVRGRISFKNRKRETKQRIRITLQEYENRVKFNIPPSHCTMNIPVHVQISGSYKGI